MQRLSTDTPRSPLRDYLLWALAGVVALVILGPTLLPALPAAAWFVSASLYAVFALGAGDALRRTYPHATLGACNVVTLGRLVIVTALVAPLAFGPVSGWALFALAAVALALDGVDGWLARRSNRASAFGARFDVEVDAAFALVLSLHALDSVGPMVLVLGLARYAFVLAAIAFPSLNGPLPERFSRKAVCVLQLATLILLQVPSLSSPVATGLVVVASAALAWSFGRDILQLSHARMTSGTVMNASRLVLAALVLHVVLVQPNHPAAATWGALFVFPLELPVILLALMAFGTSVAGAVFRMFLVAALVIVATLKTADFAAFTALARGFNPVADLPLVEASVRLLAGTVGSIAAAGIVVAALLVLVTLAAALWWATGVWSRVVLPARAVRASFAAAVLAAGVATAEIADAMGRWDAPIAPPGAAFTARVGVERVQTAAQTFADLRLFRAAAQADPFVGKETLLDALDRDVIVVFVESYGRTSIDTPYFAEMHLETLERSAKRLEGLGLAMQSGYVVAPTRGGQSWLSHATFANGLWIDDQTRYGAALASGRETLFHIAARSGFRTAAVMPAITLDWPESARMGFGTVLAAKDLGYAGKPFNWVTMPDQFTLAALDRLLRTGEDDRHLFAQVALVSSHAPWVPVPALLAWEDLGDGRVFDAVASSGDPPEVVWRDRDRVREQYRLAVDYALETVFDYAARHAEDPPLLIVIGDHQAAGFVALDERPDVPVHLIGPRELVDRAAAWGWTEGLVPGTSSLPRPMDEMRDLIIRTFTTRIRNGDAS